jgi:hypothetical protein
MPLRSGASAAAFAKAAPPPLRTSPDPAEPAEGGRTKIWQLATSLHCSIIGTCLPTGELRALLRKFKAFTTDNPTDHDLHALAVSAAGTRSLLAKQIQKALDRRHGSVLRRFAMAASTAELCRMWDEATQTGDIPGGYWAVLTHPLATDDLVRHAFGDVHMLSHLVGAANRADIRRLHQLEGEKRALEEKLARQQTHLREGIVARDAKIRDLSSMLAARIEQSDRQPSPGEIAADIATLRELVADLQKRLGAEAQRRQRAERRANELAAERTERDRNSLSLERDIAELRRELDAAEAAIAALSQGDGETESALDLGGRTLLYVGGRPHLVARLRVLIERASGRLIDHDGGIEDRRDLLAGLVSRADVAFFPVDCISHDAAQSLKRLCAQSGKPFVPLRSSSVASLLQALRSLGLDRAAAFFDPEQAV